MTVDAQAETSAAQGPGLMSVIDQRARSQVMRKETEREEEMVGKPAEAIIIIAMRIVRISISIAIITMIHIGVRITNRDTGRLKAEEIEMHPGLQEEVLLTMAKGRKEEEVIREADKIEVLISGKHSPKKIIGWQSSFTLN